MPIQPEKGTIVRDLVSPADSTSLMDMLIPWFGEENLPEIYSQNVAEIPVTYDSLGKVESGKYKGYKVGGQYRRQNIMTTDSKGNVSFLGSEPDIVLSPEESPGPPHMSKSYSGYPTGRIGGAILHEAWGHGLLDVLYNMAGMQKDEGYNEIFPEFIEAYVNLSYPNQMSSEDYLKNVKAVQDLGKQAKTKLSGLLGRIEANQLYDKSLSKKDRRKTYSNDTQGLLSFIEAQEKFKRMKKAGIKVPPTGNEAWDW